MSDQEQYPSPYYEMGGEPAVKALVDRFYELMDTLPEAYEVRKMHPDDLSSSNEKLFLFLSGWLGGPDLYVQKYGHPRLRARHLPYPVDIQARDQWLMCMDQAIDELIDEKWREGLKRAFADTANHMRNKEG